MNKFLKSIRWVVASTMLPALANAQEAVEVPAIDTGDTAWMIVACALVLFMTLPGLALFYAGLVRAKNVLSVLMQCFAVTCLVSIIWLVIGYSLAFSEGNMFIGGVSNVLLSQTLEGTMNGDIPDSVFAMFQLTFAIITPALIVGGFAERMRFSAVLFCGVLRHAMLSQAELS